MNRASVPWILLASGLALYGVLALASLSDAAPTFDETKHLPAGYTFLTLGDFRLDPDNPALARMIAAVPLLFTSVRIDLEDPTWKRSQVWLFGHRFMYEWNDADRLLYRGRLMVVALGALLAFAVFRWAERSSGAAAAAFSLFFCVLSPDLLA